MYSVKAYRINDNSLISQSPVKRDWMENTHEKHAYNCFPVTLTNSLGWTVSFPEDIHFVWDGISDTNANHVKILQGNKYAYSDRSNATLSFNTGIVFNTEENVSLLTMPVPNLFSEDYQIFTTIISTSFFKNEFPIVAKIIAPNKVITIKAGTPIATILPISLSEINNSEIVYDNIKNLKSTHCDNSYSEEVRSSIISSGKWTNFYRDGVDACGNVLGKHEAKSIRMKVVDDKKNN